MSAEEDPEVVADLKLRAYTEHDRSRTRGVGVYEWRAPEAAEIWNCRGCGSPVPVTEEALHACGTFDRELVRKGEPPLVRNRIVFCSDCKEQGFKISADRNRKAIDTLADLIRQLKDEPPPNEAYTAELLRKCALLHHPDVDGLKQAIEERRKRKPAGRERRGGM